MLAGLPQAPTKYSPVSGDFKEAKQRQQYVLSKMYEKGFITLAQAKEAANEQLVFNEQKNISVNKYPYFTDYVKQELAQKIGDEAIDSGGIKVYTTLDSKNQDVAEAKAKEYMQKFANRKVTNAAIVVLDNKDGGISAMVGGVDYEKSKVNVATSPRQPGSSFKPIVYTAGLFAGYSPATRLYDRFVNFGGIPAYTPKNYDGKFHGDVTFRNALANSLNIPAVEMTKLAGIDRVLDTAKKMGINTLNSDPNRYGLSIGLGSGEVKLFELARAYSIFANNGEMSNFSGIQKIVDNEGTEIYIQPKYKSPAIDPRVAFIMSNVLSDNQARSMVFGTNNPLTLKNRKVGAKTGTTDDYADSWTMGFTPQFTTGVWMGNNDHSVMVKNSGVEGAAYIWHDVMEGIHEGLLAEDFVKPDGLTEAWVSRTTGLPAGQGGGSILEYFLPGTEPKKNQDYNYLNQFKVAPKK
jgi:membrane peptidoglycan carboxypeptidase